MSGWVAIFIVVLLAIPFAFFGMEQYLFQSNANYVAKVSAPPSWWKSAPSWWPVSKFWIEEEISPETFRQAFEQERQRQREVAGERFDARAFESDANKRAVLEQLIDQAALRLAAQRSGLVVSDTQVRETIQAIPAFQLEGQFNAERYQLALQGQGQTPRQFEQLVRESLLQAMLQVQVAESAFVTNHEADRVLRMLSEKRDLSVITLAARTADTGDVSDADIQAWHAEHGSRYRAPETVTLEYLDIDGSALPAPAAPDEAALRQRYEQEKARFVEPEQRQASHILLAVDPSADAATQQAVEARIKAIAEQARQPGADFAALAREHSEDPGSKASGGDLGWVERDMMVKPFEDALFAMQPGQVSAPVKTQFGWHVLQLREVKAGAQVAFEDVRDQLASELAAVDKERGFNDLVGAIVDEVYKNPTSLESAAALAKLPVQTIGPATRDQLGGVLATPAVLRAAFSESMVESQTVSDPIEIAAERTVLLRVSAHTPERALTVAEAREQIIADIRADRASKQLHAQADALVARLRKGEAVSALAAELGVPVTPVVGLTRATPVVSPETALAYFAVRPQAEGAPAVGKVELEGGGMEVFVLEKVTPGDPSQVVGREREEFVKQLADMAGAEDTQALQQVLRKGMRVQVVESRL